MKAHVVQVDRGAFGPSEGHGVPHAGHAAGGTRTQPAGVRAHASVPSGWRGAWEVMQAGYPEVAHAFDIAP